MEKILDQEFNENEKDETQINRITCLARLVLFIFIAYDSYRCYRFYASQGSSTDENSIVWTTTILFLIFVLSYIYYNFILARAEWTSKYVKNVTSIWSTGFVLLIYTGMIYGSLVGVS